MAYALYNNEYYLKTNGSSWQPVKDVLQAKTYKEKDKALNVAMSLPKLFREKGYHMVEIPEVPLISPLRQLSMDELTQELQSSPEVLSMVKKLCHFVDEISDLKSMFQACREKVSFYDKLQEDFLHRIEFESMASGNVAHLGSLLHKCRVQRRIYKNMAFVINDLATQMPMDVSPSYVADKAIMLSSRSYTMRTEEAKQ